MVHATVGGPQIIQILGYDAADKKIYFTREYHDETGRLPQLYYFALTHKMPQQLVPVQSIYSAFQHKHNVEEYQKVLNKIEQITQRLHPIAEIPRSAAQVNITDVQESLGYFWEYHTEELVKQYRTSYTVQHRNLQSKPMQAMSYLKQDLEVVALFALPDSSQPYQLAIVEYLGVPQETGYQKQDVILLKQD